MSTISLAGAPERKKLDALRAEREQVVTELEGLELGPISVEEGVAVTLASFMRRRAELVHEMRGHTCGPQSGALPADAALWLMTDEELAKHVRAGVARDNTEPGPPREERNKRRAKLGKALAQLDVEEEREILRLERAGYLVDRRVPESGADVDRVLAVWDAR